MKTVIEAQRYTVQAHDARIADVEPYLYSWSLRDGSISETIIRRDGERDPFMFRDPRLGWCTHATLAGAATMIEKAYIATGEIAVEGIEQMDAKDQAIVKARFQQRASRTRPQVGDWIERADGRMQRFSSAWDDGMQTTDGGSFYLLSHGDASFSGSLDPPIPLTTIKRNGFKTRPAVFWIFHHDSAGAGRGVHFSLPCRMWRELPEIMDA